MLLVFYLTVLFIAVVHICLAILLCFLYLFTYGIYLFTYCKLCYDNYVMMLFCTY